MSRRSSLRVKLATRPFVRHVAMTGGAELGQAASAMAAGIIVARVLGPSATGTLTVLASLAGLSVLVGSLGIQFSAIYFLGQADAMSDSGSGSERKEASTLSNAVISNSLFAGLAGGLVTAAGLAVGVVVFRHSLLSHISISTFLLFLPFVPLHYFNTFARRVALGTRHVFFYLLPEAVSAVGLVSGTALALTFLGHRLKPLVILLVLLEAVSFFVLLGFSRRLLADRIGVSLRILRRQILYGLRNYAGSLLWLCLLESDAILCNDFIGARQTGVYSVAVSLGLPITFLASVSAAFLFQRVASDPDRPARIANTNRVARLIAAFLAIAAIGVGGLGPLLIPLIYGNAYAGASTALVLLLPGFWCFGIESILMSFLGGEGSPPIVYRAPLIGLILNFVANLFVIPAFGIDGAAATSSVAYFVVLSMVMSYYLKSTGARMQDVMVPIAPDLRAFKDA